MQNPQVVVGVDGTVTADWGVNDQSGSGAVWAVRESPGRTWDTPVAISSSDVLGNTASQTSKIVIAAAPDRHRALTPDQADRRDPAHAPGRSGAPPLEGGEAHRRVASPPGRHALRPGGQPSRARYADVQPDGPRAAPPRSLPRAQRPRPARPGLCAHRRARQALGAPRRGRPAHAQVQGPSRRSPPATRPLHGHGSRGRVRRLGHAPPAFHDRGLSRPWSSVEQPEPLHLSTASVRLRSPTSRGFSPAAVSDRRSRSREGRSRKWLGLELVRPPLGRTSGRRPQTPAWHHAISPALRDPPRSLNSGRRSTTTSARCV